MSRAIGWIGVLLAVLVLWTTPAMRTAVGGPVTARAMAQDASDHQLFLPLALRSGRPAPRVTATATSVPGSPTATITPTAGGFDTPTVTPSATTAGPTPDVTDTPGTGYPDLTVGRVHIGMEDTRCYYGQPLGTGIEVRNIGTGAAGPFVVEVNEERRAIPDGIAPGESRELWFAAYRYGADTVAVVDVTDAVSESDEDNNSHSGPVPIPTPPMPCPTPTPMGDPPDLVVADMWIGYEDERCDYGQPAGTFVRLENQGAGGAGAFVVHVNGKGRAIAHGLAAGADQLWWFPTYKAPGEGETVAAVDTSQGVAEAREDNNERRAVLAVPTAPPPCPTPTVPPAGEFELEAIPPAITNSVPGQRCVFLVAVQGDGGGSPITLSATAPGAQVVVEPQSARPGMVAEITVIPAADQQETTVPVTIRGVRDGETREITASLDVLADMPGVDEERGAYAATVRDRFVPWLEANHPELGITTSTSWTGTVVTPQILVVMHYLFFSAEWEMHVDWHIMIPPYDWARIDLRHRFDETRPSYAFEIESWSSETEPRPTEVPEEIWR